ncbi:hypothetical protein [Streptomyces sp. NPDC001568]|uniref:hypothetical protein n=1 Tax=Streptomyces sp. NPDC001568 TaxID=3364588 RepID=UPI0036A565FD
MSTQPTPEDPTRVTERRRPGIIAFLTGAAASLAFFAFFPGLPHVIDWGAIITSVAVGALTRWAWQARAARRNGRRHHARPGEGHEKAPGHGE